jgi:formamidopyrimidine-DNA glycosylase
MPMPELPEVETVRRGLEPVLVGARIDGVEQRRANLRFPFPERFVERLTGTRVMSLSRRAKYLLAALDSGETLILHLGMSGSFRIDAEEQTSPGAFHFARSKNVVHDHVVLRLSGGARVTYNDPRRFGFMQLEKTADLPIHPLFSRLGVEPLDSEFDAAALAKLLTGRRSPLKAALLDQSLIAGLGNIYVCEAFRQTDGELGYFQHAFRVYGKEGAACSRARCEGTILRIMQSGRSTFYCPDCQL